MIDPAPRSVNRKGTAGGAYFPLRSINSILYSSE
jgi:hypothetical protein